MTDTAVPVKSGLDDTIRLVLQLGSTAAIACYAVWVLSGRVLEAVSQTQALMQQHTVQAALVERKIDQMQVALDISVQIQKFTCVHAAHNGAEQNECYEASKR